MMSQATRSVKRVISCLALCIAGCLMVGSHLSSRLTNTGSQSDIVQSDALDGRVSRQLKPKNAKAKNTKTAKNTTKTKATKKTKVRRRVAEISGGSTSQILDTIVDVATKLDRNQDGVDTKGIEATSNHMLDDHQVRKLTTNDAYNGVANTLFGFDIPHVNEQVKKQAYEQMTEHSTEQTNDYPVEEDSKHADEQTETLGVDQVLSLEKETDTEQAKFLIATEHEMIVQAENLATGQTNNPASKHAYEEAHEQDRENVALDVNADVTEKPDLQAEEYTEGGNEEVDDADVDDDEEALQLENPSPCNRVDPGMPNNLEFQTKCRDYLAEPYIQPDCTNKTEIVPRIYHSVSATNSQFYHQLATAGQNPTFQRNHLGNEQARDYIEEKCGPEAAQAYDCFAPPAYRADLFRFCALSAEGGVYLDQDILPFVPLEELYSPCSVATVGHDFPWNDIKGKQMKILAGAPGAPIFKCAVNRIVQSVRDRYYPSGELALTGPQMLEGCFQENSSNVAITYHDTRNAAWPYTGMRAGQKILAYEIPISGKHFWQEGGEDENDYTNLFQTRRVYKDSCTLHN